MMGHFHCRLSAVSAWMAVAILTATFFPNSTVWAQPDVDDDDFEAVANVFLPAPRALRQNLLRAQRALAEQRYSDAVDELGALLAAPSEPNGNGETTHQDYFVGPFNEAGTQTSLKAEAQRLLGSMPAQGRQWYELKFGADARSNLQQAIDSGDATQLVEVTRQYFHTEAGYEATLLLGRYQLDQGRPLAAALWFKRLADTPAAVQRFDPELSLLLATCWLYADMPNNATACLVRLRANLPSSTLRMGGRDVRLFDRDSEALAWLREQVGIPQTFAEQQETQWVMFRGNATRNGQAAGSFPLMNIRWQVPTANDPLDAQLVSERRRELESQGIASIPSVQPLAVANTILMRTPEQLVAVDLDSGKRIWEWPWYQSADEHVIRSDRSRGGRRVAATRTTELSQRMWEDSAYGQLSSDGQQVFLLHDLGFAATNYATRFLVQPQGRRANNPGWPKKTNQLVALNIREQGKLRWIVGGETGEDEPKLAGAFFLGVPLPMMDQLFTMAELNGEIRLVVLDGKTGQLLWSQQLAHVDNNTILMDAGRRLAGAMASFSEGVLVCPTAAGAVVAVDVSTRSLLWGYLYDQAGNSKTKFNSFRPYPTPQKPFGSRWIDGTATIAEGAAIITPLDSDNLYCLDLLSGNERWSPKSRTDHDLLFVAGVHEGVLIVVGKSEVFGYHMSDGSEAWQPLSLAGAMPSGRGFLSKEHYFLPTSRGELWKLDVNTGQLVAKTKTDKVLGNLVCYKDQVISHHADWLAAYYQSEPLRGRVAQMLKDNPEDHWALLRQAELLLQDGDRHEAVRQLRKALVLQPEDDTTRSLLVSTLLEVLRDDFAANQSIAVELDELVDQPQQRAEYLRLMADGMSQSGKLAEAFGFYLRLGQLEQRLDPAAEPMRGNLVFVEPELAVNRRRWVQSRMNAILSSATPEQRTTMQATIVAEHEKAKGSLESLRRFVDQFGLHPAVIEARLDLARQLIEKQQWLEAEFMLLPLEGSSDPKVAGQATALLARIQIDIHDRDQAARYLRRLAERFADVPCQGELTGRQVVEQLATSDELKQSMAGPAAWPYGRADVTQGGGNRNAFPGFQPVYPIELQMVRGPFSPYGSVGYNQRLNSLTFRDGDGKTTQQVLLGDANRFYAANYTVNRSQAFGHLVIATAGFEILAVDTMRTSGGDGEVIKWRNDLSGSMSLNIRSSRQMKSNSISGAWGGTRHVPTDSASRPLGQMGPLTYYGVCYQKLKELVCVDPISGELLWTRSDVEPGCDLFGDDQLLFVVEPDADEALVLDALDGTIMGRRKVEGRQFRWTTQGRNVLSCQPTDDQETLRLRLFDAWSGATIWEHEATRKSIGTLIGFDELAMLQPDGRLRIISLADGRVIVDKTLEQEKSIENLYVVRSRDQYLVSISVPYATNSSAARYYTVLSTDLCPLVTGNLYAFDRQSGQPQWNVPARITQYGFPLDQPSDVPILVFMRHVTTPQTRASAAASTRASVLILDRRTGRRIYENNDLTSHISSYDIVGDPESRTVQVSLTSHQFSVEMTDEPIPPEPPAQLGGEVTTLEDSAMEKLGKFADAILNGLVKQQKEQAAQGAEAAPPPNDQ